MTDFIVFHFQVVAYLFANKILAPSKFILIRGNHEIRGIQRMHTFYGYVIERLTSSINTQTCIIMPSGIQGTAFIGISIWRVSVDEGMDAQYCPKWNAYSGDDHEFLEGFRQYTPLIKCWDSLFEIC